ncbi:MAG TPA: hypothetical protein GXX28_12120 [Firmicutes bacterium]|nr:hypothetical protein [Bacillota bacterium]
MERMISVIVLATAAGTLARLYLLRVDYRQYPSYPQGYLTHLFLGFIAAAIGAVAVPALLLHHYEAVTFLVLAATQFRDIRSMERDSLQALEKVELVPRGTAYIEGIAKVFEARNYVAMFTALWVGAVLVFFPGRLRWGVIPALGGAAVLVFVLDKLMTGRRVGDYARVKKAPLHFKGPLLYVGDIMLMNVGLEESRRLILEHGLGAILEPVDINARATLASPGQRQAIVHDLSAVFGIRRDVDEPEFTPLARLNHETGEVGLVILPVERDAAALVEAIARVPVIENIKRKPTASAAGRRASHTGGGGA